MSTIARFVLRHPRKILAFWVVLLLLSGVGASRLSERVENGGYGASGSQAVRAGELEEHLFGAATEPQAYLSVLAAHGSRELSGRDVSLAAAVVRGVGGVKQVGAPVLSADRQAALMPVVFAGEYGYAQTRVPAVEAALAHVGLAPSTARLVGQVGIYQRYMVQSKKSLSTSSLISFPVTLAILLVAFLSVVAALLPLGLAAVCVGVTFGFLYLLTYVVQLSVFVEDTVLVLGLGLSIDFSLFMVTRVRESLAREGASMEEAITETLQTTGRAITVSGADGRDGARRPVRDRARRLPVAGHGRDRRRADRGGGRVDAHPRGDRAARRSARSPLAAACRRGRAERRLLAPARRLRRAPARRGRRRDRAGDGGAVDPDRRDAHHAEVDQRAARLGPGARGHRRRRRALRAGRRHAGGRRGPRAARAAQAPDRRPARRRAASARPNTARGGGSASRPRSTPTPTARARIGSSASCAHRWGDSTARRRSSAARPRSGST